MMHYALLVKRLSILMLVTLGMHHALVSPVVAAQDPQKKVQTKVSPGQKLHGLLSQEQKEKNLIIEGEAKIAKFEAALTKDPNNEKTKAALNDAVIDLFQAYDNRDIRLRGQKEALSEKQLNALIDRTARNAEKEMDKVEAQMNDLYTKRKALSQAHPEASKDYMAMKNTLAAG